jgi:hypothetical protein
MGNKNKDLLDRLALQDFGTTEVPSLLRGDARILAKKLECTPREALDMLLKKQEESKKNIKGLNKLGKSQRKTEKALQAKKYAKVGRSSFNGLVNGGLPGLGKRK